MGVMLVSPLLIGLIICFNSPSRFGVQFELMRFHETSLII
ncbi:hypothetical protein Lser_V15G16020 [Lactuca serriola]